MNIFSTSPGVAMVLRDPQALPMVLALEGWGGFTVRSAVMQGIAVRSTSNYQFLHTLRGYVYAYVFGERMGELIITGLTFNGSCVSGLFRDGISQVLSYYDAYRISRSGATVGVQIGAAGFSGFLTGTQLQVVNPEGRIGQFQLSFSLIPPVL